LPFSADAYPATAAGAALPLKMSDSLNFIPAERD
jgi:hypothetical protein